MYRRMCQQEGEENEKRSNICSSVIGANSCIGYERFSAVRLITGEIPKYLGSLKKRLSYIFFFEKERLI